MVQVYSRLLEETILCVEDGQDTAGGGDGAELANATERVLYTRSEVVALQGQPPDALRAVHEVKKYFGGRYLGPSPAKG